MRCVHWLETPVSGTRFQRPTADANADTPPRPPQVRAAGRQVTAMRARRLFRETRALAKRERKQYTTQNTEGSLIFEWDSGLLGGRQPICGRETISASALRAIGLKCSFKKCLQLFEHIRSEGTSTMLSPCQKPTLDMLRKHRKTMF